MGSNTWRTALTAAIGLLPLLPLSGCQPHRPAQAAALTRAAEVPPRPRPAPVDMPPLRPAPPLPPPVTGAPPRYRFTALPKGFSASALGEDGSVAGHVAGRDRQGRPHGTRGAVWRNGRLRRLVTVPAPAQGARPWPFQEPVAVAPSGIVVGEVQTGFSEPVIAHWMYIAVWDRHGRVARIIPHPAERSGLRPAAVNAHGVVVGRLSGTAVAEQDFPVEAILWAPDGRGLRMLGEGRASDINDRGEVVGSTEEGRAVFWTPSGAVDLGQGYAAAINNRGEVVGTRTMTVSGWPEPSTGFLFERGRRTALTAPGCRTAGAADVNDRGQIVGWGRKDPEEFYSDRAILWQGGRGYALDPLVRGMRAGWRLRGAGAVNERGQILCAASYRNDTQRACLLTPAGGEGS